MKVEYTRYEGVKIGRDQFQLYSEGESFLLRAYGGSRERFGSGSSATLEVTPENIDALIEYLQQVKETIQAKPSDR